MARFVGRDNVRKRLAPLEGEPGRTSYSDGAARIEAGGEAITVRPPFGLPHNGVYESVQYVTGIGGRIMVDSTPDAGTRVRVVLPLGHDGGAPALEPEEAA